jgi:urease accessory protein
MTHWAWPLAAAMLATSTQAGWAHPSPLGFGGLVGGLLHPLFVPAHLLAIVALGLLIGRQAAWARMAVFCFVAGLAVGLGVMTLGVVPQWMNELVLGSALIAGLLTAWARSVPETLGCALAVLTGFCIALDSPPEVISLLEANLMLLGTGLGAVALLIAVSELVRRIKAAWAATGVRVLGSWIAASAILVLMLGLAR